MPTNRTNFHECLRLFYKSESSQVLNYLNATSHKLGILVNFGAASGIESKRLVLQ
ncbi:MAG TPA: hypothetical protein DD423_07405 [Opitutae bacterium]|nr:hypothetical protein [Opitutae bacterium]